MFDQCALSDNYSLHLGEAISLTKYVGLFCPKYIHPHLAELSSTHTVIFTLQNMQWTLFIIIIASK
jgi:hypothetical protein